MRTVAIQGGEASFHDIAARSYFKRSITPVICDLPFKNVFAALNEADYAICAIENSLYGSINEVYDLLIESDASIIGEVYLKIDQALIGFKEAKLNDIKEVHSHPVALAQCEQFLDEHLPESRRFEHHDTALSVRDVKQWGDPSKAAIASRQAAELYGMHVLRNAVETNRENYTRFVVLRKKPVTPDKSADKTSLVLRTAGDTKPGALYRALGTFAERDLNLTLLHSRPLVGKAWHYMFYIDVVGGLDDGRLEAALKELASRGCEIERLGSYASGIVY
ncbi:MAG: prephenate dehydratase [Candidatus Saccharibacteria bacterium]|nr:prephenate dehydratase [Candidatus Saccharibacteria bacterium]